MNRTLSLTVAALIATMTMTANADIVEEFKNLDKNKDGALTSQEVIPAYTMVEFEDADEDKDGKLTIHELYIISPEEWPDDDTSNDDSVNG